MCRHRVGLIFNLVLYTFAPSLALPQVPQTQTPPDRLAGYWNVAESKKKVWEDLDRQLTQMLNGSGLCENYAEVHEKMDQVLAASDARIAALEEYYAVNRELHQLLVNAAKQELASSESRARHIQELWDLE